MCSLGRLSSASRLASALLIWAGLACGLPECEDTEGWVNRFGAGCSTYFSDGHCDGMGVVAGHEWTTGVEYDYPEQHCCICGKGVAAEDRYCHDTPGWHNQYDKDCASYLAEGRCGGKGFLPHEEWSGGEEFRFPENHCCACGKPTDHPPPPPAPPKPPPCFDAPLGWANPFGTTCAMYLSEGHCTGTGITPGREWTASADFGSPQLHCCGCGKLADSPPPSLPLPPPPPPPPPPSPPPSPLLTSPRPPPPPPEPPPPPLVCKDECPFQLNGICQDGGPNALGASCRFGTDCGDCGPRSIRPPPPPKPPPSPSPPPPPPLVRHSRPRPSPPRPPAPPSPPPPPPPPPLEGAAEDSMPSVTLPYVRRHMPPTPPTPGAPAADERLAKLHGVEEAAGAVLRSGASLASEGGAALAAQASTAVQRAADRVVAEAGLTPEQGQLVGIGIGTAAGVLLLCCARLCWCYFAADEGGGGRRAGKRRAEQRRAQRARLVPAEDEYWDDEN